MTDAGDGLRYVNLWEMPDTTLRAFVSEPSDGQGHREIRALEGTLEAILRGEVRGRTVVACGGS